MNKFDNILIKIIRQLFPRISDKKLSFLIQFFKFGIVGLSNTIISYSIYCLTLYVLKPFQLQYDYFIGNILSFVLSVLWSFYWNNKFVFKLEEGKKRNLFFALSKTYISYSFTGIILTNILSYIWIDTLGVPKYIAPIINLVISVPLNFVINKFWSFRSKSIEKNNDIVSDIENN